MHSKDMTQRTLVAIINQPLTKGI